MAVKKRKLPRIHLAKAAFNRRKKIKQKPKDLIVIPRITDWDHEPAAEAPITLGIKIKKAKGALKKFVPLLAQWMKGTSLAEIHRTSKQTRSTLWSRFAKLVGGERKLKKLRAAGAGSHVPFGGKRAAPRVKGEKMDDSKAVRIQSKDIMVGPDERVVTFMKGELREFKERIEKARKAREKMAHRTDRANAKDVLARAEAYKAHTGWRGEHYRTPLGVMLRLISPSGERYVKANSLERADVLVEVSKDLPPARMKLEREASSTKKHNREERLISKGEKARTVKLKAKHKKLKAKSKSK